MKIGFVAVSGVRAANPKLMEVGLTLPGFVERKEVIASMPSLGLLTLAALTPPDIDVSYHEIRDVADEHDLPRDLDLVAISSYTAQIADAYRLADAFRAAGVKVVLGGLHMTVLPDEAAAHADAVVVGEGEVSWPQVVDDARAGRLQARYEPPPGVWFDLADAPIPRFELLDISRYNRLTVTTSRGCPHRCDFCASSILLTPKYRTKPVDRVAAEVRAIKALWDDPFLELADDNSFVDHDYSKELLAVLRDEDVPWFAETDVSVADDAELLSLLHDSGCRQVLIGLESPNDTGLEGVELRRDWKRARRPDYERAVHAVQDAGVTVNGCFVLGLDGDPPEVFEQVYDFVERTGLYECQITVMTPFPGTPLYERLRNEGRLLREGAWECCTLFDVNYEPKQMTAHELQWGLVELGKRIYDPDFVRSRRRRFFEWQRELRERETA